jgi:hypothetical protein
VESVDGRLVSATFESGLTVRASQFIDATYEGDLAAMAGVTMQVGRESNAEFGETKNGVQCGPKHQFSMPVDPYIVPGVPTSGLLPGIEPGPLPAAGSADHRVQAYNFRMCMTDSASNRRPFPIPVIYDPLRYELLARVLESGWPEFFKKFDRIPNEKTDTNNHGPVSSDFIGRSHFWPHASHAQREVLFQAHGMQHPCRQRHPGFEVQADKLWSADRAIAGGQAGQIVSCPGLPAGQQPLPELAEVADPCSFHE